MAEKVAKVGKEKDNKKKNNEEEEEIILQVVS